MHELLGVAAVMGLSTVIVRLYWWALRAPVGPVHHADAGVDRLFRATCAMFTLVLGVFVGLAFMYS